MIWLENLNLRGDYKNIIINYIGAKYPQFMPLYEEIYLYGNCTYWEMLDSQLNSFIQKNGLHYVRNDDSFNTHLSRRPP